MYLDTDVLIRDDVNPLFNRITDDILYVLEEGQIIQTKMLSAVE
jgi:hypothetical protein